MNFVDDNSSTTCSSFSDVDSVASLENNLHHDHMELIHKLHGIIVMCNLLNVQMRRTLDMIHLLCNVYHATKKSKICSTKRQANQRRDWDSVIRCIHSWVMFQLCHEDFNLLHTAILEYLNRNGYDERKQCKYARISSGSPRLRNCSYMSHSSCLVEHHIYDMVCS
jgi:hypothetical protein